MANLLTELGASGLLSIALIVAMASAVQSAVGFGAGLVAVPLFTWLGLPLPRAIALLYGVVIVHAGYNLWSHVKRRLGPLPLGPALWMSLPRSALTPVGVWLLDAYLAGNQQSTRLAVGGGLFAALLARRVFRPVARAKVALGWGIMAGCASGLLAGVLGMGGPPIVLYALAHEWPKERFRAYLWSTFLFGLPAAIAMLCLAFGVVIAWHLALGVALGPCVWLGSELGLRLTRAWPVSAIQRGATLLLLLLAASSLAAPWW